MLIELLEGLLLLCNIGVFELDNVLLNLSARLSQHEVIMSVMKREAELAVEALVYLAAVLDLCVFVLRAQEPSRSVHEVLQLVKHALLDPLLLGARHEFLEGFGRVVASPR